VKEGWWKGSYYILFDDGEVQQMTALYGIERYLPGYTLIGLKGWDDFIVGDARKSVYAVPTVPVSPRHLEALETPTAREALERDPKWEGKIKWWITPIVFGGNPKDESNVDWISLEQHVQLVRWWNDKYGSTVGPGA
jgi:hypothetical protein